MFRLGRQVESALLAIRALNESTGSEVSIAEICSKNGLSRNTLSKVMQSLAGHNLIKSVQGVRGGYKLALPLEQISFYQVLDALGEIKHLKCREGSECSLSGTCSISSPLKKWEETFENQLKTTRVTALLYEASEYKSSDNHMQIRGL